MQSATKKRIVICLDGTSNVMSAEHPTNVVWTAQTVDPLDDNGVAQLIYYDQGVGTAAGERIRGGALGHGLDKNILEAYAFLCLNYEFGDDIYIFGFSRGAYTARSLCGMIKYCGILRRKHVGEASKQLAFYQSIGPRDDPDSEKVREHRRDASPDICINEADYRWRCDNYGEQYAGKKNIFRIKYLGVWDTVGSLGIPKWWPGASILNSKHSFHDDKISELVDSARHAVAIDETRKTFVPSLWDRGQLNELNRAKGFEANDNAAPFQQRWFPGDHCSVGGGGDVRGLADRAFDWIMDGARIAELSIDKSPSSRIFEMKPDAMESLNNQSEIENPPLKERLMKWAWNEASHEKRKDGPSEIHELDISTIRRWHSDNSYRPTTLANVDSALSQIDGKRFGVGLPCWIQSAEYLYDFHDVIRDDNLTNIAKSYYKDPDLYWIIFGTNLDKIYHPDKISAGWRIRIPKKSELGKIGKELMELDFIEELVDKIKGK